MNKEPFQIEFRVRDYECDLQGVVNNANYMHYLEHARHEYLKSRGLDFAEMHRNGVDPVVIRAEMDYKTALKSGDDFIVHLHVEPQGRLRVIFHEIVERADGTLVMDALIYAAVLSHGRPVPFDHAFSEGEYKKLVGLAKD